MSDERVVGLVGVGRMGTAILARLSVQHTVLAHDAAPGRRSAVLAAGAEWVSDLRALGGRCTVLITVLPGPGELQQVMEAMLPRLRAGSLWIDCTSGDPRVTATLAAQARRRGMDVLSAPMGGSVAQAASGSLTFYISGPRRAVTRGRPILAELAADDGIRFVSERVEDSQTVKLLANALWFANAMAATEALLVGDGLGIEPERLRSLLQDGAGDSAALTNHLGRLLDGDYLETFGIDRVVEELRTVNELATVTETATPILDASEALHHAALREFGPTLGELLGARVLEARTGRLLRSHRSG
jgi:3-hydroxyisobutyrate dehydrogenase